MPLDLITNPGPISHKDTALADVLDDLQGNILNGHGRDHAIHILLSFQSDRVEDAKVILANLAKGGAITSAKKQLEMSEIYKKTGKDAGLFVHLALSAAGYRKLGVEEDKIPAGVNLRKLPAKITLDQGKPEEREVDFYQDAFGQGMKDRGKLLQDPEAEDWETTLRQEAHALVIIADDNNIDLINGERWLREIFESDGDDPIARVLGAERGFGLRKKFYEGEGHPKFGENVEHFGFVDGRSQPLLLDTQLKEEQEKDGTKIWKGIAPPSLVLVPDPSGKKDVSFGSFLVFRKLEQNVRGFKMAQADLAGELGCPMKLAGAMAVGRFEDGTPVVLQPGDDCEPPLANDFDYSSDPAGRRCPLHAHIRKTNPRLESVADTPEGKTEELIHRIARRGIPYGGGLSDFSDPSKLPTGGVGLLFMCYQSDIWDQFEFQQRFWSNNEEFVVPFVKSRIGVSPDYVSGTGLDAIIGQQRARNPDPVIGSARPPQNWPAEWGKEAKLTAQSIARFVTMKGGEYFFSPSLSGLQALAHGSSSTMKSSKQGIKPPGDLKSTPLSDTSVKVVE